MYGKGGKPCWRFDPIWWMNKQTKGYYMGGYKIGVLEGERETNSFNSTISLSSILFSALSLCVGNLSICRWSCLEYIESNDQNIFWWMNKQAEEKRRDINSLTAQFSSLSLSWLMKMKNDINEVVWNQSWRSILTALASGTHVGHSFHFRKRKK